MKRGGKQEQKFDAALKQSSKIINLVSKMQAETLYFFFPEQGGLKRDLPGADPYIREDETLYIYKRSTRC